MQAFFAQKCVGCGDQHNHSLRIPSLLSCDLIPLKTVILEMFGKVGAV